MLISANPSGEAISLSSWLYSSYAALLPHSGWLLTAGGTTVFATLLGSVFLLIGNNRKRRKQAAELQMGIDRKQQAVELGNTGVFKSGLLKDDQRDVIVTLYPDVTTLYQAFLRGMKVCL